MAPISGSTRTRRLPPSRGWNDFAARLGCPHRSVDVVTLEHARPLGPAKPGTPAPALHLTLILGRKRGRQPLAAACERGCEQTARAPGVRARLLASLRASISTELI